MTVPVNELNESRAVVEVYMKAVRDDFFYLILYVPVNNLSVMSGQVFLVLFLARINVSCSRTQRSDAGEDQNIKQLEWDIKSLRVP